MPLSIQLSLTVLCSFFSFPFFFHFFYGIYLNKSPNLPIFSCLSSFFEPLFRYFFVLLYFMPISYVSSKDSCFVSDPQGYNRTSSYDYNACFFCFHILTTSHFYSKNSYCDCNHSNYKHFYITGEKIT